MISNQQFENLKQQIKKDGILTVSIYGTSMLPLIKPEDKLLVKRIDSVEDLKQFDIVVFWQREALVCHYIWQRNRYFNNSKEDPVLVSRPLNPIVKYDQPIHYSQIVGTIVSVSIPFYLKLKIVLMTYFFKRRNG